MVDPNALKPRILFTKSYTEAARTTYADIDGAERIAVGKRSFTPGRVTVKYHWRTQLGDDGWTIGNIEISGLWNGIQLYPGSGRVIVGVTAAPAWAREFAEANLPTSTLVLQAADHE